MSFLLFIHLLKKLQAKSLLMDTIGISSSESSNEDNSTKGLWDEVCWQLIKIQKLIPVANSKKFFMMTVFFNSISEFFIFLFIFKSVYNYLL